MPPFAQWCRAGRLFRIFLSLGPRTREPSDLYASPSADRNRYSLQVFAFVFASFTYASYKMQRPIVVTRTEYRQMLELELLKLQIAYQTMQNDILGELMGKRIPQNEAIIKFNLLATQWNGLNKPVSRAPSGMYS